jgi:Flp pilus assembly secretin CpaC
MRCHLALALVTAMACPSWVYGDEPAEPSGSASHKLHGPQLPAAAEESWDFVRLASAAETGALMSEPPRPVHRSVAAPAPELQLLQRKLADLDRLRVEIDELRAKTDTAVMIAVDIQVLEVSLTNMRNRGLDVRVVQGANTAEVEIVDATLPAAYSRPTDAAADMPSGNVRAGFVRTLVEKSLAKVLASPSLVVVAGEPASYFVGSQVPLPAAPGSDAAVEYVKAGIGLNMKAECLGGDRVCIHFNPSVSSMSESRNLGGGLQAPTRQVWEVDTSCEMALGETYVMPCTVTKRVESRRRWNGKAEEVAEETATWVVIHSEDASMRRAGAMSTLEAMPTTEVK